MQHKQNKHTFLTHLLGTMSVTCLQQTMMPGPRPRFQPMRASVRFMEKLSIYNLERMFHAILWYQIQLLYANGFQMV